MVDVSTWALLGVAAFAAGALNAVAGGGSFLTFPALVYAGIPPVSANATSALAVSPGYLGSVWGFRTELSALPRSRLWAEMAVAALGGLCGAALLLVTPAQVFMGLVPWLLVFATVLFALGPRLSAWLKPSQTPARPYGRWAGLWLVCVYGGYFNGGLGILLMALFALQGERHVHTANALKNLHSLVLSLLSVATFVAGGLVAWPEGLWMMVAATAGGTWGAQQGKRLPSVWVRRLVIATGVVMSAVFFART